MKIKLSISALLVSLMLFTGCEFVGNTFKYKDTTEAFVNALIKDDYNKALTYMALNHKNAKNTNLDTLKKGLSNFKTLITKNYGSDLEYSFVNTTKTFSTEANPNTTNAQIQFDNRKAFGVLDVTFDDQSHKIFGIPLGGLYWWWRLKQREKQLTEAALPILPEEIH